MIRVNSSVDIKQGASELGERGLFQGYDEGCLRRGCGGVAERIQFFGNITGDTGTARER